MIDANFFRDVPTRLDLNGPILSIITQPVNLTSKCNGGIATFVGLATATFPTQTPINPATNTGTLSYQWYRVGTGALSDGPLSSIGTTSLYVSGSNTPTLTLSNVYETSQYYFTVSHTPSAYGDPETGAAKSTGNAINSTSLTSNTATLIAYPKLTIAAQPSDSTSLVNVNTNFLVTGELTDYTQGDISYQWSIDGVDVSDGIRQTTSPANVVTNVYTSDASVFIPDNATNIRIRVSAGAGGPGGSGSGGGYGKSGIFSIPNGQRNLFFSIGGRGYYQYSSGNGLAPGGNPGLFAGGGAGAVGVYDSVSNGYIIIAGGGGGGGSYSNGLPGGPGGSAGDWSGYQGVLTNYSAGGDGATGLGNIGGGGGGGGVFGGNGGPAGINYSYSVAEGLGYSGTGCGCCNCDCPCQQRFGGDAYCGGECRQYSLSPIPFLRLICGCITECLSCYRNVTYTSSAGGGGGGGGGSAYTSSIATLLSSSTDGVNPFVELRYTLPSGSSGSTQITTTTTISGSKTNTLTLRANTVGSQIVRCRLSHPVACESPILSNTAIFETVSAANLTRSIITSEIVSETDSSIFLRNDSNLYVSPIAFNAANNQNHNRTFNIYTPEENVTVKITMAGGAGQSFNGNIGGQGGLSVFTYTLKRNVEYTFRIGNLVQSSTSVGLGGAAAYFYEKGRLLAVCGGGGASGWVSGNGGAGGGLGISGANGANIGGGKGGIRINTGQLNSTGLLPSGVTGGKVESCTTGDYWKIQGISPCTDVGTTQFRTSNGTIVFPTATLQRGYKATSSSGFRNNGGNSATSVSGTFVGGGGSGAYGGSATTNTSAGGGGGSGYTNGSVNIISTQQGGNSATYAYFLIELNQ